MRSHPRPLYAPPIDALLSPDSSLIDFVEAVRAAPLRSFKRPHGGMLRERRGHMQHKASVPR
jgi:hypothetical protein